MDTVLGLARKEAERLLENPNIVGVGIGHKEVGGVTTDELCIVVSVIEKHPRWSIEPDERIPWFVTGVPTDVQETGPFVALQDRTVKWRPAPGGVSVGHKDITAGTLGCLVTKDGEQFVLSNNHVLAKMNKAKKGDKILQPGAADGGSVPGDVIAALEDFIPVVFLLPECPFAAMIAKSLNALCKLVGSGYSYSAMRLQQAVNLVDAAIAWPVKPDTVIPEVIGIPTPTGHREVELGDPVVKSGRTTEVTRGTVTQVDATLLIMYGDNLAMFAEQIVSSCPCSPGDSGSIVLADDGSGNAVGLLFAGTQDGKTMIFCQIGHVLDLLGVEIG